MKRAKAKEQKSTVGKDGSSEGDCGGHDGTEARYRS